MATGLDYSAGTIRGATIRAAGHSFVIRYVGTPGRLKNITAAEYADLVSAGLSVWLVYENSVNDIQGGFAGGAAAAKAARADASRVGYPPSGVIFFAADRHLAANEIATGLDYVRGAASVLGVNSTGAYGFSEFVNAVRANGGAAWLWQCGSRSTVQPGTHVYQRNTPAAVVGGIQCDVNDLLLPIQPPPPAPAPAPKLTETPEDEMFLVMGAGSPPPRMGLLSGGIFRELTAGERQTAQDTIVRQGADQLYVEQATWDWWLQATAAQLKGA